VELTQEQLLELYDPYISLDDEHSACPFCPRSKARRATLDRMVYVRGDGEEKSYRENVELAKDLGGFLFGDLLFSAESKWTLSERFQTDRECSFPMGARGLAAVKVFRSLVPRSPRSWAAAGCGRCR
jgi:hypothetical protein